MSESEIQKTRRVLKAIASTDPRVSMTRKDAAEALGVSVRQINRLMKKYSVIRPWKGAKEKAQARRETAQQRRDKRSGAALRVLREECSAEQAAKQAGCSERTIYRWMIFGQKQDKSSKNKRNR